MSTITMTSPIAPTRSITQRLEALDKANDVRCRRAQFKRDMKVKREFAPDVLRVTPAWMDTMKVLDVLLAMPKVGRVKALKWLNRTTISPSKTMGGLSPRQRDALVALLVAEELRA